MWAINAITKRNKLSYRVKGCIVKSALPPVLSVESPVSFDSFYFALRENMGQVILKNSPK